jgi:hypothetical protein
LRKLMNAGRHIERHPTGGSKSGRPDHFPREKLLEIARHLKAVLDKRYRDRISPSTFIAFHLPILGYPPEVISALDKYCHLAHRSMPRCQYLPSSQAVTPNILWFVEGCAIWQDGKGEISRLEASLLPRLTPERLGLKPKKVLAIWEEVLRNHIRVLGSQTQLRRRVAELLGDETLVTSANMTAAVHRVDDLLTVEEDDRRHLFYEQIKEFFFAMREIKLKEVDDQMLGEILEASDRLMAVIYRIRLRRKQKAEREKAGKQFVV